VFPTASKRPGSPVAGLDALAAAVGAAGRVPVIAIGGVTPATAREVVAAGAGGVAAIGAFLSGGAAAVRAFHEAFDGVGDRVIC
jgi:thiamine monophosphate synthase